MVRINIARWLAGGFAAGILLLVVDSLTLASLVGGWIYREAT